MDDFRSFVAIMSFLVGGVVAIIFFSILAIWEIYK